jgi:hypothetical protein
MDYSVSRRRLLASVGVGAVSGLAGCSNSDGAGETAGDASATDGTTVVFTDTATSTTATGSGEAGSESTTTAGSEDVVFSGGDAAAFGDALQTAADNPGSTLEIEPGTYRLDPSSYDLNTGTDAHFELVGFSDVTIEGNGATLVFTDPTLGMLHFYGSEGLTVRNLTLDYDPVPFTQAKIQSVSREDRSVVVQLEDGYPALEHPMFDTEKVWGSTHTSDGEFVTGVTADRNPDKEFAAVEHQGDGTYRLRIRESSSLAGLKPGRRLAIVARAGNHALQFQNVDRPVVENVTIRASIAFALVFAVCDRPVAENCTIGPRADTDRLIGSDADGIHCLNCRRGPRIENCDIHHLEDDGIVVATHMCIVDDFIDDRTVRVTQEPPVTVAPGDSLRAMSPAGAVTRDVPPVADVDYVFKNELSPGRPRTITFESPIRDVLQTGDYLLNEAAANHGYTVRNNTIRNNRASLVRLASGRGEFVDNELSGSSLAAVELECDTSGTWTPKGWLYDVEIANNIVSRSGLNYINLQSLGAPAFHILHRAGGDGGATPHRDVTIRDNQVTESGDLGVLVEDATDVTVTNNDLSDLNHLDLDYFLGRAGYGLGFTNVDGATVSNNTVTGSAASLADFGWQSRSSGLSMSGNKLVVDGEASPATLAAPTPVRLEFDRTVSPTGDSRDLAVYCAALSFHDERGDSIMEIDVGGAEDGVSFDRGVFPPEDVGGGTRRWFGGSERTAVVQVSSDVVAAATELRLDGSPIESGLSVRAIVDDEAAEFVDMGADDNHVITIPLP